MVWYCTNLQKNKELFLCYAGIRTCYLNVGIQTQVHSPNISSIYKIIRMSTCKMLSHTASTAVVDHDLPNNFLTRVLRNRTGNDPNKDTR